MGELGVRVLRELVEECLERAAAGVVGGNPCAWWWRWWMELVRCAWREETDDGAVEGGEVPWGPAAEGPGGEGSGICGGPCAAGEGDR